MKMKLNALIALVMALSLPAVQAHAATTTIESAIQQLNFALTVETSPKDVAARKKAIDTFVGQIADLEKNGVSKEEIVKAVKAQLPDAQTAKDMDTLAATAKQNKLSAEQTNQLVLQYLNKAHTSGASWSDSATVGVVAAAVVITVVVVLLAGGSVSVGAGYSTSCYQCYDYYYNTYYCC